MTNTYNDTVPPRVCIYQTQRPPFRIGGWRSYTGNDEQPDEDTYYITPFIPEQEFLDVLDVVYEYRDLSEVLMRLVKFEVLQSND
jgi:hypothetical protein